MKTLVRPQLDSTIAISADTLITPKTARNQKNYINWNRKIVSYLLLFFSFSIFLIFPESPKLSESICTRNNPKSVCNIW